MCEAAGVVGMHLMLVLACPVVQGEGRMDRWEKNISDACCFSSSLSGLEVRNGEREGEREGQGGKSEGGGDGEREDEERKREGGKAVTEGTLVLCVTGQTFDRLF